ncbi:hypothetical protein [Staphylococcus durrellii]|uniref:hypothetical protein n=1 Tax=Staphylococcus durrellii TaxID=2781773 RepID=UPI0018A07FA1|nr:hypothetical protein [Staphylococcus durrellii]MBF7017610.1 hypothetical protein [Staphylococcus durrellii]
MNQQYKQEILEPGDKNYKDKDHFSNQPNNYNKKGNIRFFNCGCFPLSIGCLGLIIIMISVFHFLTYLFSLLF